MKQLLLILVFSFCLFPSVQADEPPCCPTVVESPDRFPTLVNPNCSHCVDEAKRRGEQLLPNDTVLSWIRGYSEGGAIPFRFFLNPYPVISDSYGSFVSDPYAGFARSYGPWYHYRFYGYRGGVMLIKDTKDGTIYSALSGRGIEGPKKGKRLMPIPSLVSTWGHWMDRYPNAVAYQMYPKYEPSDALPVDEQLAKKSRGKNDDRLPENSRVLGVYIDESHQKAYPMEAIAKANLLGDSINGADFVILYEPKQKTAAAYLPQAWAPMNHKAPKPNADGVSPRQGFIGDPPPAKKVKLKYEPDAAHPEAPYLDSETQTRFDIAGRGVAGTLKGWTLQWLDNVQVKWFAWAMEYPDTALHGQVLKQEEAKPKAKTPLTMVDDKKLNDKVKQIAGTSEFLKSVPKKMARVVSVNAEKGTIVLVACEEEKRKKAPNQADFFKVGMTIETRREETELTPPERRWSLAADAELKYHGWWGRLNQFQNNDLVWVWFKTDRNGKPVSISMLTDTLTEQEMHGQGVELVLQLKDTVKIKTASGMEEEILQKIENRSSSWPNRIKPGEKCFLDCTVRPYMNMEYAVAVREAYDPAGFEELRAKQKEWLRSEWIKTGLPGTVTFTHIFNGELDLVLDHETMRWSRNLKPGEEVELVANPLIKGIVKMVQPQRERTLVRLVVNGKDQADLTIGQRAFLKVATPSTNVDTATYPADIDQPRSAPERIEWFLASIYCTCGVGKDTCTGHVYTLACCNPNGCGMPNDMRKKIASLIETGKSDKEIFDELLKIHGPNLIRPHLKP